jgi:hypothetical protein
VGNRAVSTYDVSIIGTMTRWFALARGLPGATVDASHLHEIDGRIRRRIAKLTGDEPRQIRIRYLRHGEDITSRMHDVLSCEAVVQICHRKRDEARAEVARRIGTSGVSERDFAESAGVTVQELRVLLGPYAMR